MPGPGRQLHTTGGAEIPSCRPPLPQLAEKASRGAAKSGYLNKYRAQAEQSLWAATWENRFVIVRGTSLTYYRSETDVQYPPRGQIDLQVREGARLPGRCR